MYCIRNEKLLKTTSDKENASNVSQDYLITMDKKQLRNFLSLDKATAAVLTEILKV